MSSEDEKPRESLGLADRIRMFVRCGIFWSAILWTAFSVGRLAFLLLLQSGFFGP